MHTLFYMYCFYIYRSSLIWEPYTLSHFKNAHSTLFCNAHILDYNYIYIYNYSTIESKNMVVCIVSK